MMGPGKCIHGAEGARITNGVLRAPLCEHCTKQDQIEEAWALPAYENPPVVRGYDGYLSLMPEG